MAPGSGSNPFVFACPLCHTPLTTVDPDGQFCPRDQTAYPRSDGIWCFLPPQRQAFYRPFVLDYEAIRLGEGRGSVDPAYYRALPFQDQTGQFSNDWRIRAASYRGLLREAVVSLEYPPGKQLKILDLGAGNGWLSYRLAQRGHHVAAVDLLTNTFDGLGAFRHYDVCFTPMQAEYDRLPLTGGQADLVVYNASFHYSTDYLTTLKEAQRVLAPGGRIAIVDTPLYQDEKSGRAMVEERHKAFAARFGFPSDRLPSGNYLTFERLQSLSAILGIAWETITPFYGLRWLLRPLKARLLGRREPARFAVLVGRLSG
jgi:SAM-dependent methyltransferase